MTEFLTLASVFVVSLISFVGIFWLATNEKKLRQTLFFLVSFSAGALLGDVFFHLLPELADKSDFFLKTGAYILLGIFCFLLLEKFVCWRHCHVPTSHNHIHPVGFTNLAGDALHNLIDGMIIAGSFLVSLPLGIATSLAVIFHEIPQEIGDFGVLIHAGFTKNKALFFNFISALFAVLGALIVLWIGSSSQNFINFILAVTAGGFIYVACTDLIPEIHKECRARYSLGQLIAFVFGIAIMALLLLFE